MTCKCPPVVVARGKHFPGCALGPPEPPVFDSATAPIGDFTCPAHREDVPVEFVSEMVPSGLHPKVRCADGHVTNGMPVARYRVSR